MVEIGLRRAQEDDLPAITALYNYFVEKTVVTFDIGAFTVEARRSWLAQFAASGPHQLFIAEVEGRLAGYAGTMSHRKKAAYATSVETTIYVDPSFARMGVGRALYGRLFDALRGEDVRSALAAVTAPNPASAAFHRAFGFTEIGVFHEVGRKFGRFHDVLWLEKRL